MGSQPSKPAASPEVDEKQQNVQALSRGFSTISLGDSPISPSGTLTLNAISDWESTISANPKLQLSRSILNHTDIRSTLQSREGHIAAQHVFNHELDFKTGPITNQKSSGRCWLFASTNVFRYSVMKKLKLEEFQLSQAYLFFWDKLNKSNYYLELMIENADLDIEDRLISHLSHDLISDGGQWDMVVNLVETYGLVPQPIYPESLHSSLSGPINTLLKSKLREHALILRDLLSSLRSSGLHTETEVMATIRAKKESLMKEVYTIMTATLGVPPSPDEKFVWDYYDKDGKAGRWEGTPKDFYKTVAIEKYSPNDSFSLIHDPRHDLNKLYTVDKLGNVWGGRPVLYVNTEIENLKKAIVTMIKAGHPVFFGCDVGKTSDRDAGVMSTDLFTYEAAFDITLGLTKSQRLQIMESSMTHAMVISGVHIDPSSGKPTRYKVENSWGTEPGNKGYFVMTDKWFDEFVYQVVVPKALAPKELVKVFEGDEKVVLPPWDPMGSLA